MTPAEFKSRLTTIVDGCDAPTLKTTVGELLADLKAAGFADDEADEVLNAAVAKEAAAKSAKAANATKATKLAELKAAGVLP